MYAAIRQAKAKTGTAEELARRIKEGAIPIISDVEGFKAYYVVYAGDDTVTAISLFNNFAGAEEANKRALAWIEQELSPLLDGPASAVAGPVIVALCGAGCKSPISGATLVSAAVIKQLESGDTYVNVHTAKNPGGEIRGQVKGSM